MAVSFADPVYLFGIPIAFLIILFLVTRTFVQLPLTRKERRRQRLVRIIVLITRTLLIGIILALFAQPFTESTKEVQGNPRVTIVTDRSQSMDYLESGFVDVLAEQIGKEVPTTMRSFGSSTSDVGAAILQNIEPGGNVLLISDGWSTDGTAIDDVLFYATTLNATVSMVNLTPRSDEWSVTVAGPSKVVAESETEFAVRVRTTSKGSVPLTVTVDDTVALAESVEAGIYSFTTSFTEGSHRIEARLDIEDGSDENDQYYKTVSVLKKPKILLLSEKTSPLELLLDELYEVEKRSTLPADLSPYYALVVNDLPVEKLTQTDALRDFLIDESGEFVGGGAVFFAGLNSFDRGGYSGSSLEQFLPVKVGKGERRKGSSSLVFIIDVSGSTGGTKYRVVNGREEAYTEDVPTIDVIKAQVTNAIEQLRIENQVGVIVFGIPSGSSFASAEEAIAESVKIVQPLDHLYNNRKELLDKVPRIEGGGLTAADIAFRGAVEMLKGEAGDKTVILMTDGRYSAGLGAESPMKRELLTLAKNANAIYGINFMGIGVGTEDEGEFPKKVDETFLKDLARSGDGTYDRATRLNTLLIKYGDPKAKEYGTEFVLVPLSLTHFITRDVEPDAVQNSYAQVVPKDTAQLLVTSDSGEPSLTVWRYGNGRVATWSTYAGNNLGQLLSEGNSLLVSRSINWAIGDPQRKEAYFVEIPDIRINERGEVTVRSSDPVTSDYLEFTKLGDTYVAEFTPVEIGFGSLLAEQYAVNRPREGDAVGINPRLGPLVQSTGGKVFKPSESEEIIEHVKAVSRRVAVERNFLGLPLIIAALAIFLVEILLRRLLERREG